MTRVYEASLEQFEDDKRNANKGTVRGKGMLDKSVRKLGAGRSIVVDKNGRIIAGNKTRQAMVEAGITQARVVETDGRELVVVKRMDLDLEEGGAARELAYADNRVAEMDLDWDIELLKSDIHDGVDVSMLWTEDEISSIMGDDESDQEHDEENDIIAGDASSAITKPGDIWHMGEHRLICGDSTDPKVVEALFGGDEGSLLFTSPPYLQQRKYKLDKDVEWESLMAGAFSNLRLKEDAQILVNLGLVHIDGEWQPYWDPWIEHMRSNGWRRFGLYVWDQLHGIPGLHAGRLAPSFELIFHFNKKSIALNKSVECKTAGAPISSSTTCMRKKDGTKQKFAAAGGVIQDRKIPDSIFRVARQHGLGDDLDHPAPFPVALPLLAIETFTQSDDVVYDPFGGSGSTLLACERSRRSARLIEIAPEYCDVVVARWERMTGGKAHRS